VTRFVTPGGVSGYHVPPPGYPYQAPHSYEQAQGAFSETQVSGDFAQPDYETGQIVTGARNDWSGAAKFAVVIGGAVAIYLIYRMSEGAKPVAKKLGGIAEKIISARTGDLFGGGASSRMLAPKHVKMTATPLSARMVKST